MATCVCGRERTCQPHVVDDSRGAQEVVLGGISRRLGARADAQLVKDAADVPVHRSLADEQLQGDRPVGSSRGDEPQDLELASAQSEVLRRSWLGCQHRVDPVQVRAGAELRENLMRRLELELRAFVVAERPAGLGDEL